MTVEEYLDKLDLYYGFTDEDGGEDEYEKLKNELLEYNNNLVEKYPFLEMRNVWTDKKPDDNSVTWLDDMPDGWRIAFGEQMCEEIKEQLIKDNCLEYYRIHQIKEKFGSLRWYDSFGTEALMEIVNKYEVLSWHTCINCGKPSRYATKGWIAPYCEECAREIYDKIRERYKAPENCDFNMIFDEIRDENFI